MTNLEMKMDNGAVAMCPLENVLVEEIDDVISIHADNGFMLTVPKNDIENEQHTESMDVYELYDGLKIILEFERE